MNHHGLERASRMSRPCRKMTTIDAMILVAGTAAALTAWRGMLAMPALQDRSLRDSPQWYYFQALGTTALLIPLSLSLLAVVLRPPRPRFRRMLDRPAVIVGLTVLVVFAIDTAILLVFMMLVGFSQFNFVGGQALYYCRMLAEQSGMCLAVAWFTRAIARRCRGPMACGWLDRLGWALACWVLLAIGSSLFTLL